MERLVDHAVATGYVHTLVFEGERPSWDEIRRYSHGIGDTPPNLVRDVVTKNRLNDRAVAASAILWSGMYAPTPSKIKLGTGAPPLGQDGPLTTDEDCWIPDDTTTRACDVKAPFLTVWTEFGVTYELDEIAGKAYSEALLMTDDGQAWAHVHLTAPIEQGTNQTVVVLWKVRHQGN